MLLKRVTTEYVKIDDRIRLLAEAQDGTVTVLWLTQRLALRLLPLLFRWLERQGGDMPRAEVLQSFAQQKARAALPAQAPVKAPIDASPDAAWLVHELSLTTNDKMVQLTFKQGDSHRAVLRLEPKPLRQWLGILHKVWRSSGWPLAVWPEWVSDGQTTAAPRAAVLH